MLIRVFGTSLYPRQSFRQVNILHACCVARASSYLRILPSSSGRHSPKAEVAHPLILLFFLLLSFQANGQWDQYSYKRPLQGIKGQWHKLVLPDEIYGKLSQELADIRIFGITETRDTIEAPYILKISAEERKDTSIEFELINQSYNAGGHFFTFQLPVDIAVNTIELEFEQENFDWKVTLEGSQNQKEWFTLVKGARILSIKNRDADYQYTRVNFPASRYPFIRMKINTQVMPDNKEETGRPTLLTAKITERQITEGIYRTFAADSSLVREEKDDKQTLIEVTLKRPMPVSYLKVTVVDTFDYYRPLTISYPVDSFQTQQGWKYQYKTLASGTLSSLEDNIFRFNNTILKKLRVAIDNHDNTPLKFGPCEVKGYEHELTLRITEPARYFLVYGNPNAIRPFYDIDLFENNIPASLPILSLGAEEIIEKAAKTKKRPLFENKAWLWAMMGLIVLALGWFTLRMMRKSEG